MIDWKLIRYLLHTYRMFPREFVNICIYIAQLNTQIEEKCIQSNLTNEINIYEYIANTSIFALWEISQDKISNIKVVTFWMYFCTYIKLNRKYGLTAGAIRNNLVNILLLCNVGQRARPATCSFTFNFTVTNASSCRVDLHRLLTYKIKIIELNYSSDLKITRLNFCCSVLWTKHLIVCSFSIFT